MIISFYGTGYIKAQQGDSIIAFNPISKNHDAKAPKFGADIAFFSLRNHPAWNGKENISFGSKEPFIVEGPGEYEIGGNIVRGFASEGPDGMVNTIFSVTVDGIRICYLGGLAKPDIDADAIEAIGPIDILMLPIGGNGLLEPKEASKLAANLSPRMVIPIGYNPDKDSAMLKQFLKDSGVEKESAVDKLTVKRKDLEGKEGEIVVIKS